MLFYLSCYHPTYLKQLDKFFLLILLQPFQIQFFLLYIQIHLLFLYLFHNKKQEYFYCLYFNNKQELIGEKLLFIGTINRSVTHPREIFKEAYRLSASSIVCMHNHPSNDVTPSMEDIDFTNKLVSLGTIQGIPIIDHLIVGQNKYFSFSDNGLL